MSEPNIDPGLSALKYRAGTHSSFKARMLASIGTNRALTHLTTRKDDDFTVALVDAWATVLDVLTFYQERIANEGYLRTATERRSVLELARAIGYELNPGVAASVYLAFTVNGADGSPAEITVPAGTRVQSMPVEEELPQTFETLDPLEGRAEWNALHPGIAPMVPRFLASEVHVRGVSNRIVKGDMLLVIGNEGIANPANGDWDLRRAKDVIAVAPSIATTDADAGFTTVVLDRPLGAFVRRQNPGDGPHLPGGGDPFDPLDPLGGGPGPIDFPVPDFVPVPYRRTAARIYVFRQRTALFGHNAPDWRSMSIDIQNAFLGNLVAGDPPDWPRFNLAYASPMPAELSAVCLDAVYPNVAVDSWIVLSTPARQKVYQVRSVSETALTDFMLTAKTTRLVLDRSTVAADFPGTPRDVVVFTQSELLEFAPPPSSPPVSGTSVTVIEVVEEPPAGRPIVAVGADPTTGLAVSEVVFLSSAVISGDTTTLQFTTALAHAYAPETMTLHANVVLATHGQSTSEVLGSANAGVAFQKLALRQKPVTYISAANASGGASTLLVRVNGIEWSEVGSFQDCGPDDRVYITLVDDEGTTIVQFGDGVTGARPPTGIENVTASYRVGLGATGVVDAGRISLLLTRPLGLDGVVNYVESTGGADPQTLDEAREHAPFTVLTLDRVVSLQDFEDFAGGFAGIGKAQASLIWNGQRRVVHLTVGGSSGATIDASASALLNLRAALDAARQTDQPVQIDGFRPVAFRVEARITIDPDHVPADVIADATSELVDAFSFSRRAFGEPVTKSEVLATLQNVEGVVAIDLDALYFAGSPRSLETLLVARRAEFGTGRINPAELLTLATGDVLLIEA